MICRGYHGTACVAPTWRAVVIICGAVMTIESGFPPRLWRHLFQPVIRPVHPLSADAAPLAKELS